MVDTLEMNALKAYEKDLVKLIARQEKKVQLEKEKTKKTYDQLLEDYPTEDHIRDACGFDAITKRERNRLLSMFNNRDKVLNGQTPNSIYLNMLKNDIKRIRIEIQNPE